MVAKKKVEADPNEKNYEKARNWILENKDAVSLSTWCDVDESGKLVGCVGHGCHANFSYTFNSLNKPCVVHGEKFCTYHAKGEADQRYWAWLCDNKASLFSKWSENGMELIKDDKKIVGALWKNMQAPNHIVSQWFFAGRCVGEHRRGETWDTIVQAGLDPVFAFWAMHFFQRQRGKETVFSPSRTTHIGITSDNTLPRVWRRAPILDKAKPFVLGGDNTIYSNYIWVGKKAGFSNKFPTQSSKSASFGTIRTSVINIDSLKDGFKMLEDSGELNIA